MLKAQAQTVEKAAIDLRKFETSAIRAAGGSVGWVFALRRIVQIW